MIGIIARGQMGNQMFQYAFCYATSRKLNKKFFIYGYDSLHYFKLHNNLKKYNNLRILLYGLNNLFTKSRFSFSINYLKNFLYFLLNWAIRKNVFEWPNSFDEKNYFLEEIKDNTLYQGFFQSEKYFKNYKEDIEKLFKIRTLYKKAFLKNKAQLFDKKTVAVHLRRKDYLKYGNEELGGIDMTLPMSYYKKCLDIIGDIDDYNVIFVSDDIEFAKKEFASKENYFFEKNDEITDFQILLNADILIVANSTFSWWAAWLNNKKEKIIYAPNYFLGFKIKKFYPAGIKVNDWNWIDAN